MPRLPYIAFHLLIREWSAENEERQTFDFDYSHFDDYISDGRCERFIDWNIVANVPPPHEPVWPSVTAVAYRTNILAKIYLLLSTVWIIASLLLIGERLFAVNYCFMQNNK